MAKKTKPKKKSKKYSADELIQRKEQSNQRKEIRDIMKNIGFDRLPYIDGKEFIFEDRTSEMDDIFIKDNIILITEYTIGTPGTHLLKKKIFYDKILEDEKSFIEFLINEDKLKSFRDYYDLKIKNTYTKNQLQLKILYCSKKSISLEHKRIVDKVIFFDYHIVQYFKSLTKTIKRSSKYEFLEFLNIEVEKFGENIKNSSSKTTHTFTGNILPEEKSKFEEGYKIVSFYIDADSLLRRSYVLRQNGWKDIENVGHYQRMLETTKINAMRKYLVDQKRVFINNIIATITIDKIELLDENDVELPIKDNGDIGNGLYEVSPTKIKIEDSCNIIGLIDGQHRTYAYHEGDDIYEKKISELRSVQNLLVTGILFPKNVSLKKKLDFEAKLFLEINNNQKNVPSHVVQEIQVLTNPFSTIAIGKKILAKLNQSGPLNNLIEQYWYEKGKLKTASIVSYGLRPLIKIEDLKAKDSLFFLWGDVNKSKLKSKNSDDFEFLNKYIEFSAEKIRDLLIAFKSRLDPKKWTTYSPITNEGLISVSFINGILNVLRLLIENNKVSTTEDYKNKLNEIDKFDFKQFKSSQYRKLGKKIYNQYFE
ncbi:DGQHR domain-containing protein [Chryseobacterium vrystaatense]|uniref:DGQHR domain-containing protein n=1 Tax=Chryseobacterium vrystaatense TaxID=307480 RepID=A0A1M5GJL9_9FLAO|nr:DGQHR domain-containing protein [Chryseobacterium vrystaatense]SHG03893.1 DGQHR domain-containing protein [Chryseobacterium vrystaatense]